MNIPKLEDYDISSLTGFIPDLVPLESLKDPYFQPWESLVSNLPALILNKTIRGLIDNSLPELSVDRILNDEQSLRRAYVILGFLTHAYVWSFNHQPPTKLPNQLAKPFKVVSAKLGLPPVATYAAVCLWNFKPAFKDKEYKYTNELAANNFSTINTFTGSLDESWFYLVSVQFEIEGSKCLSTGMKALEAATNNKPSEVFYYLQQLAEYLDNLGSLLMTMEEMCDPYIFYFRIRPFLAGWKNMKEFGLLNDGLLYGDDATDYESYSGGSNAQSSLIQYFDTLLNVVHLPTGVRPGATKTSLSSTDSPINKNKDNFMNEMQSYMPQRHRDFLNDLAQVNIIKQFVEENSSEYPELLLSYDGCLAMLKSFRDKHIQIVTRYIVLPSKSSKNQNTKTLRIGLAKKPTTSTPVGKLEGDETGGRGTGGTSLLPFLKQCRDETGDPAAGSWGRRILTGGILNLKYTNNSTNVKILKNKSVKISLSDTLSHTDTTSDAGHW